MKCFIKARPGRNHLKGWIAWASDKPLSRNADSPIQEPLKQDVWIQIANDKASAIAALKAELETEFKSSIDFVCSNDTNGDGDCNKCARSGCEVISSNATFSH